MKKEKLIKIDLCKNVANRTGIARNYVQIVVDESLNEITNALLDGKSVELRGFGSFSVQESSYFSHLRGEKIHGRTKKVRFKLSTDTKIKLNQ